MAELTPLSRPFRFLSLPLELRIKVYLACTNDDRIIPTGPLSCNLQPSGPHRFHDAAYEHARGANFGMNSYFSLLRTCHQIRLEATPIFDNHGQCIPTISKTYAFLKSIGRLRRTQLRRLSFVYHLTQDDQSLTHNEQYRSIDKLAELELAVRCFRRIGKDCINLREFSIYMSEGYLKRYERKAACSGGCLGHAYADRAALAAFRIREIPGMRDLRSIQGVETVKFVPICEDFGRGVRSVLNEFAGEMMKSKKDKKVIKKSNGTAIAGSM